MITEYVEGALAPEERTRFDGHVAACRHCREYLRQMRITVRASGALREESIPPAAREALLAAFRGWKTRTGPDHA